MARATAVTQKIDAVFEVWTKEYIKKYILTALNIPHSLTRNSHSVCILYLSIFPPVQLEQKVLLVEAQLEKQLQSVSTDSQSQSEELTHVSAHSCLKPYSLKLNMRCKTKPY